ncbi:torsin-1A-like isoform X2 [Sitophilus oryzae]|uniref:Torsin-1A-like isoform X2 n=1 Tax=Sitophilus oryzae TaxID=7048 RepID=A0A6J2Y0G5_SITOR|nr:torsin-1A-like isoform X2 [Sitophilus oryzae]
MLFRNLVIFFLSYVKFNNCFNIGGFKIEWPTKLEDLNLYCKFKECCNDNWIKYNRVRLVKNLTDRVYGQPLLNEAVDALSAHFNPYYPPTKALTLSFHGMTGTGKNFVSKFIAESIYKAGSKSKYVHHFIGRMHFSERSKVHEYKSDLYSWLKGNMSDCPQQLFIFDEVDKIVPEVLNAIKPVIDYRDNVDGIDYSQSVFIFLSNTGADLINEHYYDLHMSEGKSREQLSLTDFEWLIKKGIFNEEGGFHHSDTIKNNLIDHYIPFLPLEERHIRSCIREEFRLKSVTNPRKEHIEQIMQYIEWGPDSSKTFSKTGCKRIGQKVALLVAKYYKQYFTGRDEL